MSLLSDMSNSTRVVIIDLHCDPVIPAGANEAGGGNIYMRHLLRGIEATGIPVTYITRKKYPTLADSATLPGGTAFYRLDLGNWGPNDKSVLQEHFDKALEQIQSLLAQYKDNSFIFHSSYWQSGKLALSLARRYHTFYVHTVLSNSLRKAKQGGIVDDPPERLPWEQAVFHGAKYLFCSSNYEAKDIQKLYHIPKKHVLVTGLAVDPVYYHPDYDLYGAIPFDQSLEENQPASVGLPIPAHPGEKQFCWWTAKSFLYFGRIHEDKGLDYILQAWLRLYQVLGAHTPPLWIAGGTLESIPVFRSKLEAICSNLDKLEAQHLVVWWGTLSPAGIGTLLLKTQAVVTHSRYESAGLVTLEAMARGIPVLATPYGYGNDLVRDWYNGFQIAYGDVEALYHRLLQFCSQPYLAHLLGYNARCTAEQAGTQFQFMEKHLFAYGFRDCPKTPEGFCSTAVSNPDVLRRQPLDTFPYLRSAVPPERIDVVFRQLGERISEILPICAEEPDRLIAHSASGAVYLVLRLSAHISVERLWNRFSPEPEVHTISEQLDALRLFGADSGLYKLCWESTGEGLAILTRPQWGFEAACKPWVLSSGVPQEHETLEARWEGLSCLIRQTLELEWLKTGLAEADTAIRQAIAAEQGLPLVRFVPADFPCPTRAETLPFERSRCTTLAGWRYYAQTHGYTPELVGDFDRENLEWAELGWRQYGALAALCRNILLGSP